MTHLNCRRYGAIVVSHLFTYLQLCWDAASRVECRKFQFPCEIATTTGCCSLQTTVGVILALMALLGGCFSTQAVLILPITFSGREPCHPSVCSKKIGHHGQKSHCSAVIVWRRVIYSVATIPLPSFVFCHYTIPLDGKTTSAARLSHCPRLLTSSEDVLSSSDPLPRSRCISGQRGSSSGL